MSVKKLSTRLLHIPFVIPARHCPGPAECNPPPKTIRLQMFQYFAVGKADVFQLVSLFVIFGLNLPVFSLLLHACHTSFPLKCAVLVMIVV